MNSISQKQKKYLINNDGEIIQYHENKLNNNSKEQFGKICSKMNKFSQIFSKFYIYNVTKKILRYTKEVILMREPTIIQYIQKQLKNSEIVEDEWIGKFKLLKYQASQILQQDNLLRKGTKLQCVIVRRNKQFFIRITPVELDVFGPIKQFTKINQNQIELKFLFPNQLLKKLQQRVEEINKTAEIAPSLLLQIEENYYKQIFRQTDQLIEARGSKRYTIKQGIKVDFKDTKGNRIQNFYSNPACKTHIKGFSNQEIKIFQQNGSFQKCRICGEYIQQLTIDPVMDKIMKLQYNQEAKPIIYYPYINRFKFYDSKETCYYYYNYYHFRDTIKKMSQNKIQQRFNFEFPPQQDFHITFLNQSELTLIRDPCRGRYCRHLAFCQLRDLYKTKNKDNYKCIICNSIIVQTDILYLSEVEILLQIARKQTSSGLDWARIIIINDKNENGKVKIICKAKNREQIHIDINKIYRTLKNPYYIFDGRNYIQKDQQQLQETEQFNWGWMN